MRGGGLLSLQTLLGDSNIRRLREEHLWPGCGVSQEKEGKPAEISCWWGYVLAAVLGDNWVTIPEEKIKKMIYTVFLAVWD